MSARIVSLEGLRPDEGYCWICPAPADCGPGDNPEKPQESNLRIFEDGREIGPAHSLHDDIRSLGQGRFSHWGDQIYLSASASSTCPDRYRYTALIEPQERRFRAALFAAAAAVDAEWLAPEQRYAWGEHVFSAFAPEVRLSEFGRSWLHDAEFTADYERFDTHNYRSFDRKFALKELLKLALRVPGDLAECGVFRGASAFLLAKAVAQRGGRQLHLFDSFAGLSTPGERDGSYWQAGSLACALPEVESNLAEFAEFVQFHPGWIPERFVDIADRRFCFVHIDVDLFRPTFDSLTFFYPRMIPGGLIVCDDYGFDTCPGARHAMDSFFAGLPEPIVHLPTGQGFVVVEVGFTRARGPATRDCGF